MRSKGINQFLFYKKKHPAITLVDCCCILLITLLFTAHQFSAVSRSFNQPFSVKHISSKTQSHQAQLSLAATAPLDYTGIENELEEEHEHDYYKNKLQVFNDYVLPDYCISELLYHSFFRSRYAQHLSSAKKHPAIPFFVLYHSWKTHLS